MTSPVSNSLFTPLNEGTNTKKTNTELLTKILTEVQNIKKDKNLEDLKGIAEFMNPNNKAMQKIAYNALQKKEQTLIDKKNTIETEIKKLEEDKEKKELAINENLDILHKKIIKAINFQISLPQNVNDKNLYEQKLNEFFRIYTEIKNYQPEEKKIYTNQYVKTLNYNMKHLIENNNFFKTIYFQGSIDYNALINESVKDSKISVKDLETALRTILNDRATLDSNQKNNLQDILNNLDKYPDAQTIFSYINNQELKNKVFLTLNQDSLTINKRLKDLTNATNDKYRSLENEYSSALKDIQKEVDKKIDQCISKKQKIDHELKNFYKKAYKTLASEKMIMRNSVTELMSRLNKSQKD